MDVANTVQTQNGLVRTPIWDLDPEIEIRCFAFALPALGIGYMWL